MFQTDLNLWLQSLQSPALTWLLWGVSRLGYTSTYVALILGLVFGWRLRAGLAVLGSLLLAAILTNTLKAGLAFPRPGDVDTRVALLDGSRRKPAVEHGTAPSFWALPPDEARAAIRDRDRDSFGFPSGHVAAAAAFFLAAALFLRSRLVLLFALGWIPLMAVSRLYLGVHFLADVLGGAGAGALGVAAAALLLHKANGPGPAGPRPADLAPLGALCAVLVFLTPFAPALDTVDIGRLAGVAAAYAFVLATGLPADGGTPWQRVGRILSAAVLYLAVDRVIRSVFDADTWEQHRLATLAATSLSTAVTFAGAVVVSRRLGWYRAGRDSASER
jgi:membrane-associated phospholipid phosphatase